MIRQRLHAASQALKNAEGIVLFARRMRALLAFVCAFYVGGNAQVLSEAEHAIVERVEANSDESIDFLEKTVNINSGTMNPSGVQAVGQVYQQFLEDLGLTTRWVNMPPDMNRGGHLIAETHGNRGKRVLLIGHMDTVFEEESPFQRWEPRDSVAYGPGVLDMKGGNMVMLYSLKALKEAGLLDERRIVVVLHGDEESPGRPLDISRRDIIELAKRSDIALAYEPSSGIGDAVVARRSSSQWTLEVKGVQAHSSTVFSQNTGSGAIYETARVLNRFHDDLREENLTYNPGLILGGSDVSFDSSGVAGYAEGKTNLVSDVVLVSGDLRTISNEQLARTRDKMEAIVANGCLPKTSASITFQDSYPAMMASAGNLRVLKQFNKVSQDLSLGTFIPNDPNRRGAGDISFVADYVDCLDGLGLEGSGSHSEEEHVLLTNIEDITKRSAVLIHRLTSAGPDD